MKNNNNVRAVLTDVVLLGLGVTVLVLGMKYSKLSGENEILKKGMEELNKKCDDKDRYIGKILTELKIKNQ